MDKKILDSLVAEMVKDHEGGEKFFDNLDEAVRNKTYVEMLLDLINTKYGNMDNLNIIVSGKFGNFFNNCTKINDNTKIFVVNGGLRVGNKIDDLSFLNWANEECIFLDDSFYSGKTRNAIKIYFEGLGAKLLDTFVIYDGSKEKDQNVHSLYRYYDNHKALN